MGMSKEFQRRKTEHSNFGLLSWGSSIRALMARQDVFRQGGAARPSIQNNHSVAVKRRCISATHIRDK